MIKSIKLDDIDSDFSKTPKDEYFIKLMTMALKHEIDCYAVVIKTEFIVPYGPDYKPNSSEDFKAWFKDKIEKEDYPTIYVYPKDGKFIMSDEYNAYYSYLDYGFKDILCICLGMPVGEGIIEVGEPFKLPMPSIEVLGSKEN